MKVEVDVKDLTAGELMAFWAGQIEQMSHDYEAFASTGTTGIVCAGVRPLLIKQLEAFLKCLEDD